MRASGSELLQSRQKQETVAGNGECRLSRDGLVRPDLGVTDANGILLLAMIHLNLPPVKIALQQGPGVASQVGTQKIGRITIVPSGVHRGPVRVQGNHQQAKEAPSRPSLPQHIAHLFVPDLAPCASKMNPARLPCDRIVLPHRFRRKSFFTVGTSSSLRGREAQPCIFPTTTDNVHTLQRLGEQYSRKWTK